MREPFEWLQQSLHLRWEVAVASIRRLVQLELVEGWQVLPEQGRCPDPPQLHFDQWLPYPLALSELSRTYCNTSTAQQDMIE